MTLGLSANQWAVLIEGRVALEREHSFPEDSDLTVVPCESHEEAVRLEQELYGAGQQVLGVVCNRDNPLESTPGSTPESTPVKEVASET